MALNRNDALISGRIDTYQSHRLKRITASRKGGAGNDGGHSGDSRQSVEEVTHLLPVVDGAQSLRAFVLQQELDGVLGGRQNMVAFFGSFYTDMRLRAQSAFNNIAL